MKKKIDYEKLQKRNEKIRAELIHHVQIFVSDLESFAERSAKKFATAENQKT